MSDYICPYCKADGTYEDGDDQNSCPACGKKFLITGTIKGGLSAFATATAPQPAPVSDETLRRLGEKEFKMPVTHDRDEALALLNERARLEWSRAETAEALVAQLRRERDSLITVHGTNDKLVAYILKVETERDQMREALSNAAVRFENIETHLRKDDVHTEDLLSFAVFGAKMAREALAAVPATDDEGEKLGREWLTGEATFVNNTDKDLDIEWVLGPQGKKCQSRFMICVDKEKGESYWICTFVCGEKTFSTDGKFPPELVVSARASAAGTGDAK